MSATAALLRELGAPLTIEEVEVDGPRAGEVLVRVRGAGICHTDLAAQAGAVPLPLPSVLGHEGAGIVEAVGDGVERLGVGDPVVLTFDHCGACPSCRGGLPGYCSSFAALNHSGRRADGSTTLRQGDAPVHGSWLGQSSFATLAVASERNAVPVPAGTDVALLGPLGCSLLTGAGTVLEVLRPGPGDGVAVFGLGSVGLAAVMAAAAAGCDPIVAIDPLPERRELADELGAGPVLAFDGVRETVRAVRTLTGGGVRHSIDAVGSADVVRSALEVLRSPGHCATVGFRGPRNEVTIDQGHLLFGRRLSGVIEGDVDPQRFIPELVALHRAGRFPLERLVTAFEFGAINDAIEAMRAGTVVKPVLRMP